MEVQVSKMTSTRALLVPLFSVLSSIYVKYDNHIVCRS